MNEAFRHQVIYPKETKFPVKQITSNSFLFVQESDVFVVGVTRHNADAAVIFEVLHTLIKNCKLYFGGDFDEESIRGNFLLVYEILDGTYRRPGQGSPALHLLVANFSVTQFAILGLPPRSTPCHTNTPSQSLISNILSRYDP